MNEIPQTPRVIKILALAAKAARDRGYNYVGSEHLMLGVLLDGGGFAIEVLKQAGVDIDALRSKVAKAIDNGGRDEDHANMDWLQMNSHLIAHPVHYDPSWDGDIRKRLMAYRALFGMRKVDVP
jgi:ATP-dependent Clp protease ATP-binding subunit ClpA